MSLNISPETKIGRILDWDSDDYVRNRVREYKLKVGKKTTIMSHIETRQYLESNRYKIAANGVHYMHPDVQKGFLPTILEKWFDERVEYKGLMKKFGKAGDIEKEKFFHMKQLVAKVLLNSFYGVLGLQSFRFHDIDNAEAITSTGQQLIKFTAKMADFHYNRLLGTPKDTKHVIYIDTDSIFCSAKPILEKHHPHIDLERPHTTMEIVDEQTWTDGLVDYLGGGKVDGDYITLNTGKSISKKALSIWLNKKFDYETVKNEMLISDTIIQIASDTQKFINTAYDTYAKRLHNSDDHRFDIKQELVSKAGFWVAKKRYCQWVVNAEGTPADHLDVKGLDVVRSNFPKAFQVFMTGVLNDILYGVPKEDIVDTILDFRKGMPSLPLYDVMFPSSIKDFTKYVDEEGDDTRLFGNRLKGATATAKSTLNHNDLLKDLKLHNVAPIQNGDKIKWTYLQGHNPYRMETLGLKGFDDPDVLLNYVKEYIDYGKIYDKQLKGKLDDFFSSMGWGSVPNTRLKNTFFTFS